MVVIGGDYYIYFRGMRVATAPTPRLSVEIRHKKKGIKRELVINNMEYMNLLYLCIIL